MNFNKIVLFVLITFFTTSVLATEIKRASRWEGSVRGCLANATTAERDLYGSKLPRLCTCVSNFLVKTCAPKDSTSSEKFGICAKKHIPNLVKLVTPCLEAGKEPDKNPYL